MNKLTLLMATTVAAMLTTGCGSSDSSEEPTIAPLPGHKVIIDTDNLTDQDDMAAIGTSFALMQMGELNVIGVAMAGTDTRNRRTMSVSATAHYYGFPNTPIGESYNPNIRTMPNNFSGSYPLLSTKYNGQARDLGEFESDGLLDNEREDVIAMYCRVLTALPEGEKASISVLGQLYNVSDLLKETEKCNGMEIIRTKVSEIVFTGITEGAGYDMNSGAHEPFHDYTAAATNYVFDHSPVPVVLPTSIHGFPERAGVIYQTKNINSPMAFAFASYYGSHTYIEDNIWMGDSLNIIYLARPELFTKVLEGSMDLDSHAAGTWDPNGTGNSDYLRPNISAAELLALTNQLMSVEPTEK